MAIVVVTFTSCVYSVGCGGTVPLKASYLIWYSTTLTLPEGAFHTRCTDVGVTKVTWNSSGGVGMVSLPSSMHLRTAPTSREQMRAVTSYLLRATSPAQMERHSSLTP
uniref:Secreted protein n=1 Tax=Ixodes ricinus TaxID=34613 RepID=A0A147BTU6_IXORI